MEPNLKKLIISITQSSQSMSEDDEVEVWEVGGGAPAKINQANADEATEALAAVYEAIKTAPKYLRVSNLVHKYNELRQRIEIHDFDYVIAESDRIMYTLEEMKEEYNQLALDMIRIQESLQEYQKQGMDMDYDYLMRMMDKFTAVLKSGQLEAGKRLLTKLKFIYSEQREGILGPAREEAMKDLEQITYLLSEAQKEGLDTTADIKSYGEVKEALKKSESIEQINGLRSQAEAIRQHLEFARKEKRIKDELPLKASARIQDARMELFEFRKNNCDIDNIVTHFDVVMNLYEKASSEQDFFTLNEHLDNLEQLIGQEKTSLEAINKEKEAWNTMFDERREVLKEMTKAGYLMAPLQNRLEKAQAKLSTESTQDVMKQTERFLDNMDNEIDSIQEKEIDFYNFQMRLLMDFEQLSELSEKLEEPMEQIDDFIMEFSMSYATASVVDDFKVLNEKMIASLQMVKLRLGMDIYDEPELQAEEEVELVKPKRIRIKRTTDQAPPSPATNLEP